MRKIENKNYLLQPQCRFSYGSARFTSSLTFHSGVGSGKARRDLFHDRSSDPEDAEQHFVQLSLDGTYH